MNIQEAIAFIKPGVTLNGLPQHWADLGCGSGTFTSALAQLLPRESTIVAVDSAPQQLDSKMGNHVSVLFQQADFEKDKLYLQGLDGILMANSFHYIQNKELLIKHLEKSFKQEKKFLMIEYETQLSNPWVPFPIPFTKLKDLFSRLDYPSVKKMNERQSAYGGKMYTAVISKLL